MGIVNVDGSLGPVTGTIHLDDKDVTKSTVDVSIDVNGIDTREPKRDGHLKSPDFFDVAKFPTATFKSTKVEKVSDGKLKVTGNLTLHGVTKSVVLDVEGPTDPAKDPFGNTKIAASATGKIDRTDYGLTWNKPLEKTGALLVGNDITLNIGVEAAAAKK
jgi:polyisoprenoid-binding protein YceI